MGSGTAFPPAVPRLRIRLGNRSAPPTAATSWRPPSSWTTTGGGGSTASGRGSVLFSKFEPGQTWSLPLETSDLATGR